MAYAKVKLTKQNPLGTRQLQVLGEMIAVAFESRIQAAFEDGGYDDAKWAPSMVPNIGRIFALLNKTTVSPDNQRLKDAIEGNQKTLVDSGRLRNSFSGSATVDDKEVKVTVGTNLDYAPKLHYGGISVVNITPLAVLNINNLISTPDYKFLSKFLDKRNFTIRIRARKLISFDNTLRQDMREVFEEWRKDNNKGEK